MRRALFLPLVLFVAFGLPFLVFVLPASDPARASRRPSDHAPAAGLGATGAGRRSPQTCFIAANLVVDILCARLDPRVRYA